MTFVVSSPTSPTSSPEALLETLPASLPKARLPSGEIAKSLRDWRTQRGLSLGGLALRCAVDKATLSRWETGKSLPRVPELLRTLDALKVPEKERAICLRIIGTPQGRRQLAEDTSIAELPIGIGEMLRALRLRASGTQEEAARVAGVSLSLVSRWERGDCLPDPERLLLLTQRFSATRGETVYLCRHVTNPMAAMSLLPKDKDALDIALANLIAHEPTADLDLVFLALAGRYHTLWKERKIGSAEATGIWGNYADFLCWRHGRYNESARFAQAALAGLDTSSRPTYPIAGGQFAAAVSLIWSHLLQGRPLEGLKALEHFEKGMPPRYYPWVQMARGEALCYAGRVESGIAAFQEAIARTTNAAADTVRRQIYAESLSRQGLYSKALKVIAPLSPNETRSSVWHGHAMTFAWALAGDGELAEAERVYRSVRPQIGKDVSPLLKMIVDPVEHLLASRLAA